MKIFFSASIHGKKQYQPNYQKIVDLVKTTRHQILSDHILNTTPQDIESWVKDKNLDYHRWVMTNIREADAVFAELSYSSTSVGYLVSLAAAANRPVVIFYSGQEEPHMFRVLEEDNDKLIVLRYHHLDELDELVPDAIEHATTSQDVRFNFFISPSISNFLTKISKSKRQPRSVFLRKLIDDDMKNNQEYQNSADK